MKQKVLITGVAGLLGSRMAQWILDNTDYGVIGIDDLSGGYRENVPKDVDFYILNLVSAPDRLENIFKRNNIQYVYHFAAYAAEGLSPFIRSFNYQNNLVATTHIVNNCITYNIQRLVFTSSMAVYGNGVPPFSENDNPQPIDPYGIAKYACEMDIQVAGEQFGLDWCIIRPHNVYGVNQNIWDKYRNVLGIWMYQYLNDQPMTIFGDGEQVRSFSFIDDTLEPMWAAATQPQASKEIINLGGTKEVTINEANKILREEVIGDGEFIKLQKRHEVKVAVPTYHKSIHLLKYEHKTNLHEGLTKMWNWAKQQPNRKRFVWDKYEVEKGIYNFWKLK